MAKNTVFLHGNRIRKDGSFDTFWTKEVTIKDDPLPHHIEGLSYTATGCGPRIPTRQKVLLNGKWRRVYCRIYGNNGTLYLRSADKSEVITVQQ